MGYEFFKNNFNLLSNVLINFFFNIYYSRRIFKIKFGWIYVEIYMDF